MIIKQRRGFAVMNKDLQREIARKGGASIPPEKRAFSLNRDLAVSSGRKGGAASHADTRPAGSPPGRPPKETV